MRRRPLKSAARGRCHSRSHKEAFPRNPHSRAAHSSDPLQHRLRRPKLQPRDLKEVVSAHFAPPVNQQQSTLQLTSTALPVEKKGHFANRCPSRQNAPARPNTGAAPAQGRTSAPSRSHQTSQASRSTPTQSHGRVNHVTAEEAQDATGVLLGTFLVNSVPAQVLFDSGASHSFVSESFASISELLFAPLLIPLLIRSPVQS